MNRRHLLHEEIVERRHVGVGELGVRRIRHRRIEPVAVLGDALPHGAIEIRKTVAADAGLGIGRDVGRVNGAERRAHFQAAGERLAARNRMTGHAIAGPRQIFTGDCRED